MRQTGTIDEIILNVKYLVEGEADNYTWVFPTCSKALVFRRRTCRDFLTTSRFFSKLACAISSKWELTSSMLRLGLKE